jgi:Tol biopolymer transport system component
VVPKGTIAVTFTRYALDYGVGVINLDGSGRRRIFGPGAYPNTARSPHWSADGKWLAALEGGRVHLVDVATGLAREATPDWNPGWEESWPTFSPDGHWLYFTVGASVDNHYTLWRVPVDSGGAPEQLPIAMQYARHQAHVSPDGTHVLYVGGDAYLHELALADGTDRTLTGAHGLLNLPRYAPDGGMIAYLLSATYPDFDPASGVYLLPVQGASAQRITPPVTKDSEYSWTYAGGNSWSPDGEWIVASALQRLLVVNVKTGLTIPLPWSEDYTDPDWKH